MLFYSEIWPNVAVCHRPFWKKWCAENISHPPSSMTLSQRLSWVWCQGKMNSVIEKCIDLYWLFAACLYCKLTFLVWLTYSTLFFYIVYTVVWTSGLCFLLLRLEWPGDSITTCFHLVSVCYLGNTEMPRLRSKRLRYGNGQVALLYPFDLRIPA